MKIEIPWVRPSIARFLRRGLRGELIWCSFLTTQTNLWRQFESSILEDKRVTQTMCVSVGRECSCQSALSTRCTMRLYCNYFLHVYFIWIASCWLLVSTSVTVYQVTNMELKVGKIWNVTTTEQPEIWYYEIQANGDADGEAEPGHGWNAKLRYVKFIHVVDYTCWLHGA